MIEIGAVRVRVRFRLERAFHVNGILGVEFESGCNDSSCVLARIAPFW